MAARLPQADKRVEVATEIEALEWVQYDGVDARRNPGSPIAQDRIYGAFYLIASAWNSSQGDHQANLDNLHTRDEALSLLEAMTGRYFVPPLSKANVERFIGDDGALPALAAIASDLGVKLFSRDFGAKKSVIFLAKLLDNSEARYSVLRHLENEVWKPTDGANAKNGIGSSVNRIYSAIYILASAYNRSNPENQVDMDRLYSKSQFLRLVQLLRR